METGSGKGFEEEGFEEKEFEEEGCVCAWRIDLSVSEGGVNSGSSSSNVPLDVDATGCGAAATDIEGGLALRDRERDEGPATLWAGFVLEGEGRRRVAIFDTCDVVDQRVTSA